MRDGMRLSLEKMVTATDTGKTGWSLGNRYGRVLAEPSKKEALSLLAECVLVEGGHVYGEDVRMKLT